MNFIRTYRNLLQPFSFSDLLMIENHEQCALRKDPVIALFAEQLKTWNYTLCKEPVIATSVEGFKIATLTKSY